MSTLRPSELVVLDQRLAATPSALAYAPWVLAYPLRGHALPMLILCTPLLAFSVGSFQGFGAQLDERAAVWIRSLPLLVITGGWLLWYLLRIIEHSAEGHALPPPVSAAVLFSGGAALFKALLYPFLVGWIAWSLRDAGGWMALILGAGILLWPAHLLILACEGDLGAALNPLRLVLVPWHAGLPYFLVCAAIAATLLVLTAVAQTSTLILTSAIGLYGLFAVCHLLGHVAYHRSEALGLEPRVRKPQEAELEREQAERLAALLDALHEALARSDSEAADRLLAAVIPGPWDVASFHEELFARLLTVGKVPLIHAQGRRLIAFHMDARRHERALEVYECCMDRHSVFELDSPERTELLAHRALTFGQPKALDHLGATLAARWPGHPGIRRVADAISAARARQG